MSAEATKLDELRALFAAQRVWHTDDLAGRLKMRVGSKVLYNLLAKLRRRQEIVRIAHGVYERKEKAPTTL